MAPRGGKVKMSEEARKLLEKRRLEDRMRKATDPYTLVETEIHREWEETGHGIYARFSQDLTDDEVREFVGIFIAAVRNKPQRSN